MSSPGNLTCTDGQCNEYYCNDDKKDEDYDHPQSNFPEDYLIQLFLYPAFAASLETMKVTT